MILLLNTVFTCILIRDVPDSTFSNPAGSGFQIRYILNFNYFYNTWLNCIVALWPLREPQQKALYKKSMESPAVQYTLLVLSNLNTSWQLNE